jgi:hypothetical protein
MDDNAQILREKLERLLSEAADTAAELQAVDRGTGMLTHFSQIEAAAHGVGAQLSCRIQERSAFDVAAGAPQAAPCPTCATSCSVVIESRTINSTDGPIEIREPKGDCTRCRRSFFPST